MPANRARRGRPPLPAEDQRRRLLDASRQLLESQRLAAAGVREIVSEAGMSSRAFYELFDSRDALILALAEETMERLLERLDEVPEPSDAEDTERISDLLLDAYLEVAAPLVALDGAQLPRPLAERLATARGEMRERSIDLMYRRFEKAVRAGRLTALPDRTAYEIAIRGIESLTSDLSRSGRFAELASHRVSMRKMLMASAPLAG